MRSGKLLKIMWKNSIKNFLSIVMTLCIFLYGNASYCADTINLKKVIYDSAKVEIRQPSAEKQQELLHDTDYRYDRIGPAPKGLWERFTDWFWRKIAELFTSKGGALGFKIFEYALIIAAIVIIVMLILKNDVRALFYGKSAAVTIDFSEFEEDIHKINFDELITDAISKKDFRKAVRLHFLKLLKELTDNNLITWQIDKTNNDYSIELAKSKYSHGFRELTLLYEYIWYGDFKIDETGFAAMLRKFKEFKI
jgi:hypothetical protein